MLNENRHRHRIRRRSSSDASQTKPTNNDTRGVEGLSEIKQLDQVEAVEKGMCRYIWRTTRRAPAGGDEDERSPMLIFVCVPNFFF